MVLNEVQWWCKWSFIYQVANNKKLQPHWKKDCQVKRKILVPIQKWTQNVPHDGKGGQLCTGSLQYLIHRVVNTKALWPSIVANATVKVIHYILFYTIYLFTFRLRILSIILND